MEKTFSGLGGLEIFFLVCAILGGVSVILRLIGLFLGMDHDAHGVLDAGGHDIDAHHADSDAGFKILSIHGITSFFMMFGLVGFALHWESRTGTFIAMAGALAAGLASVWLIGKLFSLARKMQSSGTISIENAVGAKGSVYLTIPKDGTGRVLVSVRNSLREYDAMSRDNVEIASGTPILVVWVDGNVLVVEKI